MIDDVLTLVKETITRDAIGVSSVQQTQRQILETVNSVTRSEFFKAGEAGLLPAYECITPSINYEGEKLAVFRGKKYAIYRTYMNGDDMYLYLQEEVGANG